MSKVNNFKVHFSNILLNKYHFTKEGIDGYWIVKEKQEKFDNRKLIGTSVGLLELIMSSSLCVLEGDCIVPIIVLGSIGALTAKISVSIKNPYYLEEYIKIDKVYKNEKIKYKKMNKPHK